MTETRALVGTLLALVTGVTLGLGGWHLHRHLSCSDPDWPLLGCSDALASMALSLSMGGAVAVSLAILYWMMGRDR